MIYIYIHNVFLCCNSLSCCLLILHFLCRYSFCKRNRVTWGTCQECFVVADFGASGAHSLKLHENGPSHRWNLEIEQKSTQSNTLNQKFLFFPFFFFKASRQWTHGHGTQTLYWRCAKPFFPNEILKIYMSSYAIQKIIPSLESANFWCPVTSPSHFCWLIKQKSQSAGRQKDENEPWPRP